jgi:hypothetical protein
MLSFIAKRYAKVRFRFKQEVKAATNDRNTGLAIGLSTEIRESTYRKA